MKFSAAVLAAAVCIAPAFAADWAPQVNPEKISAVEIPAPAAPVYTPPRDGQNYSGAEELLIKEFGVTRIGLDMPEAEVMRQNSQYANAFCFEHALRQALSSLLGDYAVPTSPLARTLSAMGALDRPTKSDLTKARQKLLAVLNSPSSFVSIVRPFKFYQPANGESLEKNWAFYFRLEGAGYWAIVDRSGDTPAYIYGAK